MIHLILIVLLESIVRTLVMTAGWAAQFLLDLIEMRDNFRQSGSFLSFNEVYDVIVHLATQ